MRLRLLLLLLVLYSFPAAAQKYLEMIEAGTYPIAEIQKEAEAYFKVVGHERGSGYKPYKRWEYVALMEMDAKGVKIPNLVMSQQARSYRRIEKQRQAAESGFSFGGDWKQLGPTNFNATSSWSPGLGRVTSVGIDESNPNHLIVGSPTGGVWKTLNGGNTWTPISDEFSTVDVYALEISPYNNQQYLWGSTSGKIFRSTDAGASWGTTSNLSGSGKVIRILYHPTDPTVVYAVSESNGLFRSTNSGSSWTAVSGVSSVPGYDVEFKPSDPSTIYFSGINVYRSTNGGTSFSQINGFGTANNNYKMIGVSPGNASRVYVLESNGNRFGAFYKSTDSGSSFTKTVDGATINYFGYSSSGDDDKGQAPRDMDIAVNPNNANEVHISGVHTWKSTNGGTSFNLTSYWIPGTAASLGVGYNHADVGLLKFFGNTLYVGSDGGFFISTDGAASFQNKTAGLAIREFYKIGVSKTNPNLVTGGSQDNGTSVMRTNNRLWVDWIGADGMETFVDWNNPSILYGTSQYGSMYRSTNQGNTQNGIDKPLDVDGAWVTPFEQDPQVSTTIYVAFADVWKSTNSGTSWTKISTFDNGNLSQMKLAPTDNKRIYVSRGSSLFTTTNGGNTWVTTATGWGSSAISYLSVHPTNPQRILVVTSSGVFHSTDAGTTWASIGTGLPSGTKYCATWEKTGKNGIYVGGFGFVSYTNDDLNGQWVGFFDGLPNVRVYELEINYVSNTIFAGTYGRGLWESPLYHPSAPEAAFTADKTKGCKNLTVNFSDQSTYGATAWEWTFDGGTPASSTLQNPTVSYSGIGTYTVRLKASNSQGDNTFEAQHYITILDPAEPVVSPAMRCDTGEVVLQAQGQAGEEIHWYANETDTDPVFVGDTFKINIAQTTTFYAVASPEGSIPQHIGPVSNAIGTGGNHNGDYYLVFDAEVPFHLISAKVYANGAANRVFRLQDASQNVLLEKTIFVPNGESRVNLDMDIPQGVDLQIGCPAPANLYRNNAGVQYPYTIPGLMQITSSTAGSDYYYYLYDLEIGKTALCESDRVAVQAIVNTAPVSSSIYALGSTTLCPGESAELTLANICPDCSVLWSNGDTSKSITVSTEGTFTAVLQNVCGESPLSNAITVSTKSVPEAPVISVTGSTTLCPDQLVELSVENICPDCSLHWSTGDTVPGLTVAAAGIFTATLRNVCGESEVSEEITVNTKSVPDAPILSSAGSDILCPNESVELLASNVCPDCSVIWSSGDTTVSISVSTAGIFTATLRNVCGLSPVSNEITVNTNSVPEAPVIAASSPTFLCPGASVLLTAENVCADCTVAWSNGESGPAITVSTDAVLSASVSNVCGTSPPSVPIEIQTKTPPSAPELQASGSTNLCPGGSVELTFANLCPDCTVLWSTGETGASILVSTEGQYSAIFSNVCGDSPVSNSVAVSMGSLPPMPMIDIAGNTVLCPGESVDLTVSNVCPGCTVLWSNGDTATSITVSSFDIISATLQNSCGAGLPSFEIFILPEIPPGPPAIQASNNGQICPGESISLFVVNDVCFGCTVQWSNGATGQSITVSSPGIYTATTDDHLGLCSISAPSNAVAVSLLPLFVPSLQLSNLCDLAAPAGSNYQWFVDGSLIPQATGQFWSAEVSGNYMISMENAEGCSGTSAPLFAEACMSGTQEIKGLMSAQLYPNPAQDRVFLEINSMQVFDLQLDLFAADGRFVARLFQGPVNIGKQVIDLSLPVLPAGMYRYRLATEMGGVDGNLVVQPR